jgi:hypothetical protein
MSDTSSHPDPERQRLYRSIFEPSCLEEVSEAVSAATEDEKRMYVERIAGGGWRWSLTHPGGPYPLLRISARFLRMDHHRLMVGCRSVADGVCIVCKDPANPEHPEAWAVIDFDGPTEPAGVRERIVQALGHAARETRRGEELDAQSRLSAAELFEGVGLVAPPVPDQLAAQFVWRDRGHYATRKVPFNMYDLHLLVPEVVARPVDDYAAVGGGDYGQGSYAMSYALVYGSIAVFSQCGWHLFEDDPASTAEVNEMFTLCRELISAVDDRQVPLRLPPARLIVNDERCQRRGGFCEWLDAPLGGSEGPDSDFHDWDTARSWIEEAERRSSVRATSVGPWWPFLRLALQMIASSE